MAKFIPCAEQSKAGISLYTSYENRDALERLARAERVSLAEIGRRALDTYLRGIGKKAPERPTERDRKPAPSEIRARILADLVEWDRAEFGDAYWWTPEVSLKEFDGWSDVELRQAWYSRKDQQRQREDAAAERAAGEAPDGA